MTHFLVTSDSSFPSLIPLLFPTVRGILQHQALQFSPLCVEPLHQLVGVYWVTQVALRIRGGHSGKGIEFVRPAERWRG